MLTVTTTADCRQQIQIARSQGRAIRLVPTMGALHEGHMSLVRAARADGGFVVLSIFVNPTQFDQRSDLEKYPRPLERDAELAQQHGVDLIFAPGVEEMYPTGWASGVSGRTTVRVTGLTDILCGAYRPGHFDGVCTVVAKLFNLAQPDSAYFGQKDYQQAAIIRQMARDLDFPIAIQVCPIIREPDGLAMSSRNVRLQPAERKRAPVLWSALSAAENKLLAGEQNPEAVLEAARTLLAREPAVRVQYLELRTADTLEPPHGALGGHGRWVIALATFLGEVRLIDNVVVQR